MGEFKAASSADGSWARPPDQEKPDVSLMPGGPFVATMMPAAPPVPPPKSEATKRLLRGVAEPDGEPE